nr:UDP-N-acetylmuramoyl-L-alanine--D-glutamate ligase [Desulfobulbaceae bacterium]
MADCLLKPVALGDTVLIVGLGKSGLSAVRFFLKLGAKVKLSDSKQNPPQHVVDWLNSMNIEVEFGGHSEKFFSGTDLVLLSPGVPHTLPILDFVRSQGTPVCGELALAPHYLKTPVIAITGTNGKTTTTTLIGDIVKASGKKVFVGGNIGIPLTDYLIGDQSADWLVLEVSSFQLDTAGSFRPDIGLFLNLTPDHLDRYGSVEEYAHAKMNLFAHQGVNDVVIYNSDDPVVCALVQDQHIFVVNNPKRRTLAFGQGRLNGDGAWYCDTGVECAVGGVRCDFDLSSTVFMNFPNKENAAAAILSCLVAGCSVEAINHGLRKFVALAHRMTLVKEVNGVRYYNDSKATNIGALQAALKAFSMPVILIAGGRDKGGDFNLLKKEVSEKVRLMLLIGESKALMAETFEQVTKVECCSSLVEAVHRAHELSVPGDIVLFSPACASFDMFDSYVHRGEVFEKIVSELVA